MKIESLVFDFHGVLVYLGWGVPMPFACPQGSRRYDDAFWKELLGGGGKKSEAQNLKELGF